jgi:hypothetical protein
LRGLDGETARARSEQLIERLDLTLFREDHNPRGLGRCQAPRGSSRRRLWRTPRLSWRGHQRISTDPPPGPLAAGCRRARPAQPSSSSRQPRRSRAGDSPPGDHRPRWILREGSPASMRSLVTEKLRLELVLGGAVEPHPRSSPNRARLPTIFEQATLPAVSVWLSVLRERGVLLDFRIGPRAWTTSTP